MLVHIMHHNCVQLSHTKLIHLVLITGKISAQAYISSTYIRLKVKNHSY